MAPAMPARRRPCYYPWRTSSAREHATPPYGHSHYARVVLPSPSPWHRPGWMRALPPMPRTHALQSLCGHIVALLLTCAHEHVCPHGHTGPLATRRCPFLCASSTRRGGTGTLPMRHGHHRRLCCGRPRVRADPLMRLRTAPSQHRRRRAVSMADRWPPLLRALL